MKRYSMYIGLICLCLGCVFATLLETQRNNFTFYYDTEYKGDIKLLDDLSYEMVVSRDGHYWNVTADGHDFDVTSTSVDDVDAYYDQNYGYNSFNISSTIIVHPEDLEANKDKRTCKIDLYGNDECNTKMEVSELTYAIYFENLETREKTVFAQTEVIAKQNETINVEISEGNEKNRYVGYDENFNRVNLEMDGFVGSTLYNVQGYQSKDQMDSNTDQLILVSNLFTLQAFENITISKNLTGLYKANGNQVTKISDINIIGSQAINDRLFITSERDGIRYLGCYDFDGNLLSEMLLGQNQDSETLIFKDEYIFVSKKAQDDDYIMVYRYENDQFIEESLFNTSFSLSNVGNFGYKDDILYIFNTNDVSYIENGCFELMILSQEGTSRLQVALKSTFFEGKFATYTPEVTGNYYNLWDSLMKSYEDSYLNYVTLTID